MVKLEFEVIDSCNLKLLIVATQKGAHMNNKEVVIEALLSALNREKDPNAKANIVGGLALIADPQTVTSFCEVVKISTDERTICNAIEALKSIRNKQAIEGLITVFANPQDAICLKAVEAIIDIGPQP
jgi:HEAT repeat protein